MKMLLESMVPSRLSYCVTVWGASLGSTACITETSKNPESCSEVCYDLQKCLHSIKVVVTVLFYSVQITAVFNVLSVATINFNV